MSGRVFVKDKNILSLAAGKDGFVYAECITRNGVEVCHPTGFYKFLAYYKRKTKTEPLEEDQPSKKEN